VLSAHKPQANIGEAHITLERGGFMLMSEQNGVFVLDTNKKPLKPCHPGMARKLLDEGKAAVYKQHPFTIILKREVKDADTGKHRIKIDPGSKYSGLVITDEKNQAIWACEIEHRGDRIKEGMRKRWAARRNRRSRKTRYRPTRFDNRRPKGWQPSLESRMSDITTWVRRLIKLCPITDISYELSQFDTHKMQKPEIRGIEYQHGTLHGYTVRQYLLEKFEYQCAYCGKENVPLEVEHIVPKSRGGSDRVTNLTISCVGCNEDKNTQTAEEFGYPEVHDQAKETLKDAGVLNSIRWEIYDRLQSFGLPVEVGTGARTKYNRSQLEYPKKHWIDAACVGESGKDIILDSEMQILHIKSTGHGRRQMCLMDKHGFPRTKPKQYKKVKGFQTGDIVRAVVTKGKKIGTYCGRVAVRKSGSFNIKTKEGTVQGISHRYCKLLQRADGYMYAV